MDKFLIRGGKPLRGEIRVSGAKNACLPLMTAALLTDEPVTLENAPHLRDVEWMKFLLEHLGAKVEFANNTMRIDPSGFDTDFVPYDIMRRMRASMYAMGPMIARLGRARISLPGGCAIGERPIDIHLRGFDALGCALILRNGYVHAAHRGLRGATVSMAGKQGPSVGATCNVLMAATLADGETFLTDAACEPDVVQLGEMLRAMGAEIDGLGTRTIRVRGRAGRRLHGATMRIIPDRIEAATFLIAGAITGGDLTLTGARPDHLGAVIETLTRTGAEITDLGDGRLRVRAERPLRATNVQTAVYPGFPTDVQAPIMPLLALCQGESIVEDTIYADRFMHVPELRRLGADVRQEGNRVVVHGVKRLFGAPVMASDLRCGAALVVAGLAADDFTELLRVYHIDRGYEKIEEKLSAAGAAISRRPASEAVPEHETDMPPVFPPEFGFLPGKSGAPGTPSPSPAT